MLPENGLFCGGHLGKVLCGMCRSRNGCKIVGQGGKLSKEREKWRTRGYKDALLKKKKSSNWGTFLNSSLALVCSGHGRCLFGSS